MRPQVMIARLLATLVLALVAGQGRAVTERADPVWGPVMVPGARSTELQSRQSGHRYRLFVSVPGTPPPAQGFPVFYVLDGNASFPVAAWVARTLERRQQVTGQTPPLVVGIGYPGNADFDVAARRRDYTIASTGLAVGGSAYDEGEQGGAEAFLDFIEQEVKPLVAQHHPVDPERQALFGHSFGGLLALHALFTRPSSFSAFVASSPSIWWQGRQVLREVPEWVADCSGCRPRVQISVGALEDRTPPGRHSPEVLALLASRPMVSEARRLAQDLQSRPDWGQRVVYHELAGEDHGHVWMPALTRGMDLFLPPLADVDPPRP